MFKKKALHGAELVTSVLAQFDDMVEDLTQASEDMVKETRDVQGQMEIMRVRESCLLSAQGRAKKVRDRIKELLE